MESLFLKQGHAAFLWFLLERNMMLRSGEGGALACTSQCDSPEVREQGYAAGL